MTQASPKRKVTLSAIAQSLGIAQSTVSRALGGHPAISEETRRRVVDEAQKLDYRNRANYSPVAPRKMVGVVVAALHNQFYVHLLDCLHDELRSFGYHMTLIIDSLSDKDDYSAFDPLFQQYLDGVIFTTASVDSRLVERLRDTGLPVVLAVRTIDGLPFDSVEVDNRVAGREAVNHLAELGHRRIGFIMGPRDTSTSRDRYAGALSAMADLGITPDPRHIMWGAFTHASGYSSLVSMINLPESPTAIVCGNDTVAIGSIEAAHKHGIAIPAQLSIIGFDDISMAAWEMVKLTTIRQPIREMASLAARRLVERMRGNTELAPRHDVLPVSLIKRGTTGPV
jgi:LacI family transcriptional regulator